MRDARHHGIPARQLRTGHHDRFRPGKAEDPRRRNARPLQLLRRRRKRLRGAPRQRDGRDSGILRHTRLRDIAPGGLRPQTARRIRSRARRGRDHARHTGSRRKDGLRRILTRQFRRRLLRRHHAARSHQTFYEHGGGESALVCRHGYRARLSAETGSESFRKGFQPRSRAGGDGGRDQSAHSRRRLLGAGARRKLRQAALRKGDSKRRSQDSLPGRARGKSLFARNRGARHGLPRRYGEVRHGAHAFIARYCGRGQDRHRTARRRIQHRRMERELHLGIHSCRVARRGENDRAGRRPSHPSRRRGVAQNICGRKTALVRASARRGARKRGRLLDFQKQKSHSRLAVHPQRVRPLRIVRGKIPCGRVRLAFRRASPGILARGGRRHRHSHAYRGACVRLYRALLRHAGHAHRRHRFGTDRRIRPLFGGRTARKTPDFPVRFRRIRQCRRLRTECRRRKGKPERHKRGAVQAVSRQDRYFHARALLVRRQSDLHRANVRRGR